MNLVITNTANKKFHPYISVTEAVELFICGNINAINKKNKTFLTVQTDVDLTYFRNDGYTMDQGMFDELILNYNINLQPGDERLSMWKRNL